MFKRDQFIEDMIDACKDADDHMAAKEVMARAMADPSSITGDLGAPSPDTFGPLYHSPELTILNVVWAPQMMLKPHNHNMWAVIGVYEGREDNIFWRNVKDDPQGRIEAAGAKNIGRGDYVPLGVDIVHSVLNPIEKFTGALHVYGGDFFAEERSEWDPGSLIEQPYNIEANMRALTDANERWKGKVT